MQTTPKIDNEIASQPEDIAHKTGTSPRSVVNDALRAGMSRSPDTPTPKRYRVNTVAMGPVVGPYDLDKALLLAGRIEDEAIKRKRQLRN